MLVKNGLIIFENNEKEIWEKLLDRSLTDNAIMFDTLKEMGELTVYDLHNNGQYTHAKMAADLLSDIPEVLH